MTKKLPSKKNPHMKIDNTKTHQKYQSVRVHPDVYEYFREYAHQRKMTVIDTITLAKELLEKHDPLK